MKKSGSPYVYSTDPDFRIDGPESSTETTPQPSVQRLRVRLETKQRGGRAVSLVENFIGTDDDAAELGKKLKTFCGTGGSVKGKEIIIQGDQRDKILQWLLKNDFTQSKRIQ